MLREPDLQLPVTCPYCGLEFHTGIPEAYGMPFETECVAYTRDIGRFDPEPEEVSPKAKSPWTQIGKDYLSFIFFERIGILRVTQPGIKIQYRVQACPQCKYLFDVYANYSKDADQGQLSFSKLWPHVFGADPEHPGEIVPYKGLSWPLWLINRLGKPFQSNAAGAILLGLIIAGVGMLPWSFLFLQNSTDWSDQIPTLTVQGLLYAIALAGVIAILIVCDRYVCYLKKTETFEKLLNVRKQRDVIHWQNYTLCRLVGVQQPGKLPQLSQVDIFAGGGAVASLLIVWLVFNHAWSIMGSVLLGLGLLFSIPFGLSQLRHRLRKLERKWAVSLSVILILAFALLLWVIIGWFIRSIPTTWNEIHQAFDLLFWMMVAYLLGTGTLLTENIATYVLTTISKNPLRLTPYNNYQQIKFIRTIQTYSTLIILLLFFIILLIVSVLLAFQQDQIGTSFSIAAEQWQWIGEWASWALAIIFIGMGFGGGKIRFIAMVGIYITLQIVLRDFTPAFGRNNFIQINGSLLIMGAFFTFLLIQHKSSTESILRGLIKYSKDKHLRDVDLQIDQINQELLSFNVADGGKILTKGLQKYQRLLESLDALLKIREFISNSGEKQGFKLVEITSPFLWSLALPTIWDQLLIALKIIE